MTGIGVRILQAADDHLLRNVAPGVFDNPTDPELTREFSKIRVTISLFPWTKA